MIRRVVTIGGPPGSGKSTAGRAVAERLGLAFHSAGDGFRAEAARQGQTLEAFGRYAATHPEVDRSLDRAMQALAAPGHLLEGRIQGALCHRAGTPVHALVVTASEDVRARRIAGRDHLPVEEATARIRERERVERARYREIYGIDLDRSPADCVVDSSRQDAEAVAAALVAYLSARAEEP